METHQIRSTFSNRNELKNGNVIQIGNLQARDVNIGRSEPFNVLWWLSPSQHDRKHIDVLSKRISGTGIWLLQTKQFRDWRHEADSKSYIWCYGGPGTGKTVLTSSVVDELMGTDDEDIGVAYMYCDYADKDNQTAENIIACLVKQLSLRRPPTLDHIQKLYEQCSWGKARPGVTKLTETLRNLCTVYRRTYVVIDALDECDDGNRGLLLAQLEKVDHSIVRIFLTSRPHLIEMQRKFGEFPQVEIMAKDSDIREFILNNIREKANLLELIEDTAQLKEKIIITITSRAKGMFLLAKLQFDAICQSTTVNEVKVALEEMPTDLYESFELTLGRIDRQSQNFKNLAHRILLWLTRAKRPLSLHELRQFLALRPGCSSIEKGNMPGQRTMIHVCMGLVTMDQRSSIISLVHYSLQEYFQNSTVDFFRQGETTIAETCLTILSFDEFTKGHCYSDKKLEARLQRFPVFTYAACNWGHHAREAENVSMGIILNFLQNDLKLSAASQAMFVSRYRSQGYSQRFPRHFTGVHVASLFGLKDVVNDLLVANAEPDIKDDYGQRPLLLAAGNGHLEVVEGLLAANADVNATVFRIDGRTALQAAAEGGHLEVVERLLAANADVDAIAAEENGRTALQAAAGGGHFEVVERLLAANADVNAAAGGFDVQTALQAAAEGGHFEVVERLLAANANVNASNGHDNFTALQAAAKGGHLSVVERLLAMNACVNTAVADFQGQTALQAAAEGGHIEVVERLLAANADVNAIAAEDYGRTALQAAAGGGYLEIVGRLLTANADVNAAAADFFGRTALQAAAEGSHLEVMERLLAANADVNAAVVAQYEGRTALQSAAGGGHLEAVERLLAANANVNATGSNHCGRTALQAAAEGGHLEIVERLLAENADVNAAATNGHDRTALQVAAENGHLKVVERLLAANADVNAAAAKDYGRTALQAAAGGGHLEVVGRLLAENADVNATGGRTALQAAAEGGHLEVMERLLAANANVNAAGLKDGGRTALQAAAERGHLEVVERLLAANADVNAMAAKSSGRTALQAAAVEGHLEVVERLLAANANVNTRGGLALQAAASRGDPEIVERLLAMNADVNAAAEVNADAAVVDCGYRGLTALQAAAKGGHLEVVERLLAANADINAVAAKDGGWTALQAAAGQGHLQVVEKLLAANADVNAAAKSSGRTALQAAAEEGHLEIVERLLVANADVNATAAEDGGRTAVQAAAKRGHLKVVERLLAANAYQIHDSRPHKRRKIISTSSPGI